jgi:Spy/CpxP family protein refolding chaperone
MSSLARLVLLLVLVALVASLACWTTSHLFLVKSTAPAGDFHHWLHTQLGITPDQDKDLEQEESRFATQRKELIAEIQKDNADLATVIAQDREYSPRVMAAVEEAHHAQSMLEEATLKHIFAMKPILTPAQFDKLLQLTSETLNTPADL